MIEDNSIQIYYKRYSWWMSNDIQERIKWKLLEVVEPAFMNWQKLFKDSLNFWMELIFISNWLISDDDIKDIKEIPTYYEWYLNKIEENISQLRSSWLSDEEIAFYRIYYPIELKRIIDLSDKDKIKEYDNLVKKFNSERREIIQKRDMNRIRYFSEEIIALLDERNF